jgi:hypothetical protein
MFANFRLFVKRLEERELSCMRYLRYDSSVYYRYLLFRSLSELYDRAVVIDY